MKQNPKKILKYKFSHQNSNPACLSANRRASGQKHKTPQNKYNQYFIFNFEKNWECKPFLINLKSILKNLWL